MASICCRAISVQIWMGLDFWNAEKYSTFFCLYLPDEATVEYQLRRLFGGASLHPIKDFIMQPWFGCSWIIQEALVTRRALFKLGSYSFPIPRKVSGSMITAVSVKSRYAVAGLMPGGGFTLRCISYRGPAWPHGKIEVR